MTDRGFTHFDSSGNAVMVDVSGKEATIRTAVAKGVITMSAGTFAAVLDGTVGKGDVLAVARLAGIMAAKRTSSLIPLCHPLMFDSCTVDFSPDEDRRRIEAVCTVKLSGKTGAEMEALTGASVALLTVYDMCKALDRTMVIGDIRLCEKSGGRSGCFKREENPEGGYAD
ncbi:MAG: cyclic pyranopterin monophosphate synthase MoaC [Treponema sp.]|jgi:cyclic pyranopterin phosphate synthase|nr:cyclic pyranopterin monophosphate synthase MoaC [Treponema sp.]